MSDTDALSITDEDSINAGFDGDESPDQVDTTDTETTVETPETEVEETEESEEESPASEESTDTETEVESEADASQEETDAKELARQAYLARQEEKRQREAQVQEELDQYVQEEDDPVAAKVRQLEVEQYKNRVENNTGKLTNSYEKAVASIDLFRNPTPEVKEALGDALDEFEAKHVSIDKYGNPVEVRGDLYQFLQNKAALIQKLTQVGARQQTAAKAKTASAATPAPSKAPPAPKDDPIMAGWDDYQ